MECFDVNHGIFVTIKVAVVYHKRLLVVRHKDPCDSAKKTLSLGLGIGLGYGIAAERRNRAWELTALVGRFLLDPTPQVFLGLCLLQFRVIEGL